MPEPTAEDIEEIWNDRLDGCSIAWIVRYGTTGLSRHAVAKVLEGPVPDRFKDDPRRLPYRFIWISVSGLPALPDASTPPFVFLKVPRKITEADFRKGCTKLKRALVEVSPEASWRPLPSRLKVESSRSLCATRDISAGSSARTAHCRRSYIEAIEPDVDSSRAASGAVMAKVHATMTDAEAILEVIRQRESKILASTSLMVDLQNPFQRPAMSARDVAWKLNWITTTKTGREAPNTQRVKKELARLCAAGDLVEAGLFRTLHAGASTTLCYCTPGYMVRRRARIAELGGGDPKTEETEPANTPRP